MKRKEKRSGSEGEVEGKKSGGRSNRGLLYSRQAVCR